MLSRITGGYQDALIIGEVIKSNEDSIEIKAYHIVSGALKDKKIVLESKFKYAYINKEPKIGDYCIISIDKVEKGYKLAWGAYKTNSWDYKSLEIEKEGLYEGQRAELTVLQWFVNTNGRESNFFFNGDKAYVRRNLNDSLQIYPADDEKKIQLIKEKFKILKAMINHKNRRWK